MTIQSIDPKKAVESLKRGEKIAAERVRFNGEMVEALDAMLLRKHGVAVPESLVFYDDDAIDFSDIPELTDEELSRGVRANTMFRPEFVIDKNIPKFAPMENEGDEQAQMRRFCLVRADIFMEQEVAEWVSNTNTNLDRLLSDLLKDHHKEQKANSPTPL